MRVAEHNEDWSKLAVGAKTGWRLNWDKAKKLDHWGLKRLGNLGLEHGGGRGMEGAGANERLEHGAGGFGLLEHGGGRSIEEAGACKPPERGGGWTTGAVGASMRLEHGSGWSSERARACERPEHRCGCSIRGAGLPQVGKAYSPTSCSSRSIAPAAFML